MYDWTIIKTDEGFRVLANTEPAKHWIHEIARICGRDFLRVQCENGLKMFMGRIAPMTYEFLNQN
jgi:hypothetical protein